MTALLADRATPHILMLGAWLAYTMHDFREPALTARVSLRFMLRPTGLRIKKHV